MYSSTHHPTFPAGHLTPQITHLHLHLLPLQLILRHTKRLLQQLLLLLQMTCLQPGRHTRTRIPPRIHNMSPIVMLRLIQQRLDPRLHKTPPPRVQRLLLTPNDRLGVLVLIKVISELCPGEGIELLDARDGDVFATGGFAVFVEGGVDLAGAEDDAVDGVVRVDGAGFVRRVRDDPLEVGVADEVFEVGAGKWVAEEGFGEEQDECWK
jgi:hypothetical protein